MYDVRIENLKLSLCNCLSGVKTSKNTEKCRNYPTLPYTDI